MTTQYTPNFQLAMPDFRSGPWHDLVNGDFARIDALLYSAMSQGNVAPWTNNTHYDVGVTVIDQTDASVWMCAVVHTSVVTPTTFAQDRTAHPTYWARLLTGFAPRGEWQKNTQYFPYDLAYDSGRGIMALCTIKHISTPTGSILDDQGNWAFLLDMSDVGTMIASAVTYSNLASGIVGTNVQTAIDYIQTEIVSLNNVNVTQGSQITSLGSVNNTQDTNIANLAARMNAVETKNTAQDAAISGVPVSVPAGSSMFFYNAAAPTGWTKLTGANDFALRVVSGSGGGNGGANAFSTVMAQTVTGSTASGLPAHSHNIVTDTQDAPPGSGELVINMSDMFVSRSSQQTDVQGSGSNHNHAITMNIKYLDVIVCVKN